MADQSNLEAGFISENIQHRVFAADLLFRGFSQSSVADVLGTSQASISRLFKEDTKVEIKKRSRG